jgi:ParB family chromosome partitioning protein
VNAANAPQVAPATRVDPRTLVLAENVRRTVVLDTDFKRDIAARGVRQPIEVRLDPLDQLLVVTGQRRTLAALEAGLDEVPVVLVEDIADEADRVVEQLAENHHRAGITAADDAAAVKQLALFGLSPAQIAKRTARPKEEVTAALALADTSEGTQSVVVAAGLDLVTAAKIAEFDGDTETVEYLVEQAIEDPTGIDHDIARARRDKAERDAVAARAAELRAQGVTVADSLTGHQGAERLDDLTDSPKATGGAPAIDPTAHQLKCPGHFVTLYAGVTIAGEVKVCETAYCADWKAHGHFNRYARNTATATSGPKPEEATAERRRVVANNKASDAAQQVRRTFLGQVLQRPQLPKDAIEHAAVMIADFGRFLGEYTVRQILDEVWPADDRHPERGGIHAHRALLAQAFALGEWGLPRDFWRQPTTDGWGSTKTKAKGVLHLERLQQWGYGLAHVEATRLAPDTATKEA